MVPSQIPPKESELILRAVADSPDGASIGELLMVPEIDYARRTLQRRIDQLVGMRLLVPKGQGRARRYMISPRSSTEESAGKASPENRDWLSSDAIEIRDAVNRPIFERIPVGYRGEFLDAYLPNQTFYLLEDLRRELLEIGQVGLSDLPAGTYLRQVMHRLLIDLSWNSSRLEGDTYSLLETQHLLDLGEGAEGKAAQETQMILNHKAAIEILAEQAERIGFNRYTVCNLHALRSNNLLTDPMADGRIRARPVGINGTLLHPPEVPAKIEERFLQVLSKAETIRDPFEQAFVAMVHLPYLQPFEDVNKRVSRLTAKIHLIRCNLCRSHSSTWIATITSGQSSGVRSGDRATANEQTHGGQMDCDGDGRKGSEKKRARTLCRSRGNRMDQPARGKHRPLAPASSGIPELERRLALTLSDSVSAASDHARRNPAKLRAVDLTDQFLGESRFDWNTN